MPKDFRDFLKTAKRAGRGFFMEVSQSLHPVLEVSALQHKLALEGKFPLLYCSRIEGSRLPLVTNVFGSYALLGLALGMSPQQVSESGQPGIVSTFRQRKGLSIPTIDYRGSKPPVQEVIYRGSEVDLGILPVVKHALGDSNKYISSGMTVTRELSRGKQNVGIYRLEVKGRRVLGCRINPGSNGTSIIQRYTALNRPMEVAVVIGHHPLVGMAAGHLCPLGVNEFEIAGGLLGEAIEMTPAHAVDLQVPARAEIVIEGVINPNITAIDGPVAEAMGYYGEARSCYLINISAITMRHDAIYHDLYPAHQEHFMVSILARQIDDFDTVKSQVRQVVALNYGPDFYPGKTIMYVTIRKESETDARRAGEAVLKADRWVTMVVVVDDDVNIYDDREVLWAIATNVHGEASILPFPAEKGGAGLSAMPRAILDATRKLGVTASQRVRPPPELLASMNLRKLLQFTGNNRN